jgi:hypothetical protein
MILVLPKDKRAHFLMGLGVGFVAFAATWAWTPLDPFLMTLGAVSLFGIGKETYDVLRGSYFDLGDVLYTLSGGGNALAACAVVVHLMGGR